MAEQTTARARLDRQGRVVVPVAVRQALGVEAGDPVVMTVERRGRLVVEPRDAYLARLQKRYGPHVASVDELLEVRAAEARAESERAGLPAADPQRLVKR